MIADVVSAPAVGEAVLRLGRIAPRELVPAATRVALLINPAAAADTESMLRDVELATGTMGLQLQMRAFRHGLRETGYVEGENVAIEYRWAENQFDRLPALATELVRRQVAVIVTSGGSSPASAEKAVTATIPIVFSVARQPRHHFL